MTDDQGEMIQSQLRRGIRQLMVTTVFLFCGLAGVVTYMILESRDRLAEGQAATHRLCLSQRKGRIDSNLHIRTPLKHSLNVLAGILEQAAKDQTNPQAQAATMRLAATFEMDSANVLILPPITCP